jgi:hypothetical protein
MRWKIKLDLPEKGKIETVRRFLWLPMRIGEEVRWLERSTYEKVWKLDNEGGGSWHARKWLD